MNHRAGVRKLLVKVDHRRERAKHGLDCSAFRQHFGVPRFSFSSRNQHWALHRVANISCRCVTYYFYLIKLCSIMLISTFV